MIGPLPTLAYPIRGIGSPGRVSAGDRLPANGENLDVVAKCENGTDAGGLHNHPRATREGCPLNWTDALPTLDDLRPMFPEAQPAAQARAGFHVRRAGLGVFAVVYMREPGADTRYAAFRRWKDDPTGQEQGGFLDTAAAAIVGTIREWCPVLPSDWIVTTPPAGATQGSTYPAGILAREVATRLDLDFLTTLQRTGGEEIPPSGRIATAGTLQRHRRAAGRCPAGR